MKRSGSSEAPGSPLAAASTSSWMVLVLDTEVTRTLIRCSFPTVWLNASMRSLSGESV